MQRHLIIAGLAIAVLVLCLGLYLSHRSGIQSPMEAIEAIRLKASAEPLASGGLLFGLVLGIAALNLPGTFLVLAPAAGSIFGTVVGSVWVSLGSTLGATLSFLTARYLLRDFFEDRFAFATERVNRGIQRDGPYYLFGLRLLPVVPFPAINPLMGLTRLRTWTFLWVSQLGMLPLTVVYVNAGAQAARIKSVGGLLSPSLLGSFALIGAFPFLARRALTWFQARRIARGRAD